MNTTNPAAVGTIPTPRSSITQPPICSIWSLVFCSVVSHIALNPTQCTPIGPRPSQSVTVGLTRTNNVLSSYLVIGCAELWRGSRDQTVTSQLRRALHQTDSDASPGTSHRRGMTHSSS